MISHDFYKTIIQKSFEYADSLGTQVVTYDYVFDDQKNPFIVEISYGYAIEEYNQCAGYWDKELNFHEGKNDSCEWMMETVLAEIKVEKK